MSGFRIQPGRFSRRRILTAAGVNAAAITLNGRASWATGTDHAAGPKVPRNRQSASILPAAREKTVVMEADPTNVWEGFSPFVPNGEAYNDGLAQVSREYMFSTNFLTGEIKPWLATKYGDNVDFTECTLNLNPAGLYTAAWTRTDMQPRFHSRFLARNSSDSPRVMPKNICEGQDPGTFTFNPNVQTGPYVLQEASNTRLYHLLKNTPDYWTRRRTEDKMYSISASWWGQDPFVIGSLQPAGQH